AHTGTVAEWIQEGRKLGAPPLAGVVADRWGSIAVKIMGRLPRRPAAAGMVVQDGSTDDADWAGEVPYEEMAVAVNPDRGYVATANQQPVDPGDNGIYYGNNWPDPWRAIRLNTLLESGDAFTPDDMRKFQTDPVSARVEWFLPWLLRAGGGHSVTVSESGVARDLLREWDGRYTITNERAILFELVMDALSRMLWDELRSAGVQATPSLAVMARLLEQPDSPWWDDRSTPEVEDRDALLARALAAGHAAAVKSYGPAEGGGWRWGDVRPLTIPHLSGFVSFSATATPIHGGPGTLGPVTGEPFGASWRMVVELGSPMRAWTIYPGGQSGDPRSPWYRNRIPAWSAGRLEEVILPREPEELEMGVDLIP
ncbi:MAG: penicillin acylase family protein, partial [Gemmatimonadales bacterium]